MSARPRVHVHADRDAVARAAFDALRDVVASADANAQPLVCFATGGTFTGFFSRLTADAEAEQRVDWQRLVATHLDEYLGFGPARAGGMVHELTTHCAPLARLLDDGRFWPVPADGDPAVLAAHEARVVDHGVALQFLGIGRNGHIAFNEPGTSFDLGFHSTRLAESTRADAAGRFAPVEPPREAVTSGPRTILGARRLFLAATGDAKAEAIAAMLEGPIHPSCPASVLRRHPDLVVHLDAAAAAKLGGGASEAVERAADGS